jgi:hypothetical protein
MLIFFKKGFNVFIYEYLHMKHVKEIMKHVLMKKKWKHILIGGFKVSWTSIYTPSIFMDIVVA